MKIGEYYNGYSILEKLGEGVTSEVYKAKNPQNQNYVVIKKLNLLTESAISRFQRERKILVELKHPNIVKIPKIDQKKENVYILFMEYLEGETLENILDEKTLNINEISNLGISVSLALEYVWKNHNLVHRDLKPSNIFLLKSGGVKIIDFGMARRLDKDTKITKTGLAVGTPYCMSPEAWRNENLDIRSDLYSLGVTLCWAHTGMPIFMGDTFNICKQHLFNEPDLSNINNEKLLKIIKKLLSKSPKDRYNENEIHNLVKDFKSIKEYSKIVFDYQIKGKENILNKIKNNYPLDNLNCINKCKKTFSKEKLDGILLNLNKYLCFEHFKLGSKKILNFLCLEVDKDYFGKFYIALETGLKSFFSKKVFILKELSTCLELKTIKTFSNKNTSKSLDKEENFDFIKIEKFYINNKKIYNLYKYCPYISLSKLMKHKLGKEESIYILYQLAKCLNFFYFSNYSHGNLCPENIFLTLDGKILVLEEAGLNSSHQKDIFFWGVIAFELMTEHKLFSNFDEMGNKNYIHNVHDLKFPSKVPPFKFDFMLKICKKALLPYHKRYLTAEQILNDMDVAISNYVKK